MILCKCHWHFSILSQSYQSSFDLSSPVVLPLFSHFLRHLSRLHPLYEQHILRKHSGNIQFFSSISFPILMMEPEERYQSLYVSRYCSRGPLVKLFSERNKTILWRQLWIWLAESELELGLKQVFFCLFYQILFVDLNIITDYDSLQWRTWVWNNNIWSAMETQLS